MVAKRKVLSRRKSESDSGLLYVNSKLIRENDELRSRVRGFEGRDDIFRRKVVSIIDVVETKQKDVGALVIFLGELARRIEKFKVIQEELRQEITACLLTDAQREIAVISFPTVTPQEAHVKYAINLLTLREEGKLRP